MTTSHRVNNYFRAKGATREECFWRHVEKTESCWIWTGANDGRRGYGVFGIGNKRVIKAHRYSYQLAKGPLGEGWVLHHCDNPPCVNPDHLYLGDARDNARDMLARGRYNGPRGETAPSARLTDDEVREIRRRWVAGFHGRGGNARQLAAEFGVTDSYIRSLARGDWRKSA